MRDKSRSQKEHFKNEAVKSVREILKHKRQ